MEKEFNWGRSIRGELFEKWPKTADGTPEQPEWLCNCRSNDLGDELKINMLEAYGIPCLRMYPGDGSFGRLILGMSGQGTDIYVPKSMLEDAVALCSSKPAEEK